MQVHIGTCRSKSRGYVKATTKDTKDAPCIKFNYMSHEEDWEDMRNAIEIVRHVMRQPSLKDIVAEEILPGKHADLDGERFQTEHSPSGSMHLLFELLTSVFL